MTDNTQILKKLDEQEDATVTAREGERKEGIKIFILDNIEESKSGETIVEKLCRRFSLDAGAAQEFYNMYGANV